ncbi:MAG: NADH-quinone oxidoreductase subunit J family protein [Phycisphaerae bacterium]
MTTASMYILYAFLALGAAGVYLSMPAGRSTGRPLRWSARILGAASLAAIATYCVRWIGETSDGRTFFVVFALVAIVAAVRVVTHPKPIYCALYFVLVVLAVAALCLLALAEFLGAALVIVYAGAILVTYVFVIMLTQQQETDPANLTGREPLAAVALGFLLSAAVVQAMVAAGTGLKTAGAGSLMIADGHGEQRIAASAQAEPVSMTKDDTAGNVRLVGQKMMTTYVLAVEIAGVLLLVALVGAVGLARKRIEAEALTPAELAAQTEETDNKRRGREAPPF